MRRAALLAAGLLATSVASAQTIDDGTFSIRRDGREIGREELTVRHGRQGSPEGSTVTSRVRMPAIAPAWVQEAVVERRPDGSFANMIVSYGPGTAGGRIIAEIARRVLRIHTAVGGRESIRELPAPANLVALPDSTYAIFALVADLATEEGRRITGVRVRSGDEVNFVARRSRDGAGETRIELSGGITGTLWLDGTGLLQRVALPGAGVEVVRLRR